jgi:hypothetical protein
VDGDILENIKKGQDLYLEEKVELSQENLCNQESGMFTDKRLNEVFLKV